MIKNIKKIPSKIKGMTLGQKIYTILWTLTFGLILILLGLFVGFKNTFSEKNPTKLVSNISDKEWSEKSINPDTDYKVQSLVTRIEEGNKPALVKGNYYSISEVKKFGSDFANIFDLENTYVQSKMGIETRYVFMDSTFNKLSKMDEGTLITRFDLFQGIFEESVNADEELEKIYTLLPTKTEKTGIDYDLIPASAKKDESSQIKLANAGKLVDKEDYFKKDSKLNKDLIINYIINKYTVKLEKGYSNAYVSVEELSKDAIFSNNLTAGFGFAFLFAITSSIVVTVFVSNNSKKRKKGGEK